MGDLTRIAAPAPKVSQQESPACPDPEKLRKLREGLLRNTTATVRIIDQILAELDCESRESKRAA